MAGYYLHESGAQQGPFSFEELKQKGISRGTPIWFEGLSNWTNAGDIEELKEIFSNIPPPFQSAVETPPLPDHQILSQYTTSMDREAKRDRSVGMRILWGLLIAFVAGAAGYYYLISQGDGSSDGSDASSYQKKVMSVEEIERATPIDFLSVTGEYSDNFWGDKIKIKGSIVNKATVASYKDPVIRVVYFSKTETELGSDVHTIYETVRPNSSIEFKLKVDKGNNVASVRCEVLGAVAD
jgi:hypothetical protein